MNTITNKTLLILLTWGFTLCTVVTAGDFQNAQQKAKGDVEQAMEELYLVDEGIKNKLEQFIEGEREQYLAEIEQLKSLLADHTKTIKDLQNRRDRIVNIQKKEITQHGKTQESCDMQVEIDDLNRKIDELTTNYTEISKSFNSEKKTNKNLEITIKTLKRQLAQAKSESFDEEYGYIHYLWSPAVVGTAMTITTAIVSYIVYKYATAHNDPQLNAAAALATLTGTADALAKDGINLTSEQLSYLSNVLLYEPINQ